MCNHPPAASWQS